MRLKYRLEIRLLLDFGTYKWGESDEYEWLKGGDQLVFTSDTVLCEGSLSNVGGSERSKLTV